MRIEAEFWTSADVAERWGHDPNLRAEIKQKLAGDIGWKARVAELIDFVVMTDPTTGDTIITASLDASSTGDERRAAGSQPKPSKE